MKITSEYDSRDRAAITALFLADGTRIKSIIDDGTAMVPVGEYESLFNSHLPDIIDGNSEALLYVPDKLKNIQYYNENYDMVSLSVSPNVLYVFRLVDGVMTVSQYSGAELRKLFVDGM